MPEYETRSLNMSGIWWIPGNYKNRFLGNLRWMPKVGCILEIIDDSHEFKWPKSLGIVSGLSSDQEPITLLGCKYVSCGRFSFTGNVQSYGHRVFTNTTLVGIMFEDETEIVLKDLYAGYAGLDEYVIERYYEFGSEKHAKGGNSSRQVKFSIPNYEIANVGEIKVGLFVGYSLGKELQLEHKVHISFPETDLYNSVGKNFKLIHVELPAFLSAIMGHNCFLTSLACRMDRSSVEVFDGNHPRISWKGEPSFQDRLILGHKEKLDLWPDLLPAWINNFQTIEKLCSAYIKIMSDGSDGFFEVNNLAHLFFGLERYYKEKRNTKRASLWRALKYTICRIDSYFENIEEYISVADSINIEYLNDARNTLVHSNEGELEYQLVYHQLIFITRCVLLIEMEYPVSTVENDTSHWELWHFFADRRKPKEANS